jgi:hypothetical protein
MTFNEEPRDPCAAASPKKRWSTPRLQKYGTLMHLTATISPSADNTRDGGTPITMMQNRTR